MAVAEEEMERGIIKLFLLLGVLAGGCGSPAPEDPQPRSGMEAEYLGTLEALTELMSRGGEGGEVLLSLRAYMEREEGRILAMENALERGILGMGEAERARWRELARGEVERHLEAYGAAYEGLYRRLDEGQKWELGALMSRLR